MKNQFHRLNNLLLSVLVAGTMQLGSARLHADQTWLGTSDATWSNTLNWSGTGTPGTGDLAVFDATSTANLTTNVGGDQSVLGLVITSPTSAVTITGTTNTLTVGASGIDMSAATQNVTISTGTLALGTAQAWNVASGRTLTISSRLASTAGALTKTGSGAVTFTSAAIDTSGGININGGTINLSGGNFVTMLGSGTTAGTISFNNGTLTAVTGGTSTSVFRNNVFVGAGNTGTINFSSRTQWGSDTVKPTVTGSGTLNIGITGASNRDDIYVNFSAFAGNVKFTGSGGARFFLINGQANGSSTAAFDFGGSVNFQPQTNSGGNTMSMGSLSGTSSTAVLNGGSSGVATYSVGSLETNTSYAGQVIGNSALTKVGTGALVLTSTALSYTGVTTVSNGTLRINGNKTGAGAVNVSGSGAVLAGTGTINSGTAGLITISNNARLAPGDPAVSSGVGTLTTGSLTLNTGSVLDFEFGAGNDQVTISSGAAITLNSGVKINLFDAGAVTPFSTDGIYTLFNTTGATVNGFSPSVFTVQNTVAGKTYGFTSSGSAISLVIGTLSLNYWAVDADSSWATASNWTANASPNFAGAEADFGPTVTGSGAAFSGPRAVTLDSAQTVGKIIFGDTNSFTVTTGTAGSLILDNSALASQINVTTGTHAISAPIALTAQGAAINVAPASLLTLSDAISGTTGLLKSGSGTLALTGSSSYSGGTTLNLGTLQVNSADSLGAVSGNLVFAGGTLQMLASATSSRVYQVSGGNSARIDTNGNNLTLNSGIGVLSGAGGVVKSGSGTLTLAGSSSYTGATTVNAGVLKISPGGVINGGAANVAAAAGAQLVVDGGSLTAGGLSTLLRNSAGLVVSSGTANFNAGLQTDNDSTTNSEIRIYVPGGVLNASSITLGRGGSSQTSEPTAGLTSQFYVNGGSVSVTGNFGIGTLGNTNSTSSARIDSGTVTVAGVTTIGLNNTGRWSVLDVNGGTFTSTNAATGVQIGATTAGSAEFLVRSGTATVEKITFFGTGSATYQGVARVNGGSLYVGSGGIVATGTNVNFNPTIKLAGGTLGAKDTWSSSVKVALTGSASIIDAPVVSGTARNITLSGVLSGTAGGFTKTGFGTLTLQGTNDYTGPTKVNEGTLAFDVSETLTGGLNIATSGTAVLTAHGVEGVKVLDITGLTISGTTAFAGGGAKLDNTAGNGFTTSFAAGSEMLSGAGVDGAGLASPAPVPEPSTYISLLIGVFFIVFFMKSKKAVDTFAKNL